MIDKQTASEIVLLISEIYKSKSSLDFHDREPCRLFEKEN